MKPAETHPPSLLADTGADADTPLVVSVRALCDFAAREGDLDLRFTPSPTGVEGVAGHGEVTSRRGPDYQRELPLQARWQHLLVQGRADGFDPNQSLLEEIKTHRGEARAISPNRTALHWAQAKVYGWMLCERLGLAQIAISIVYFNVDTGTETVLREEHAADNLRDHFSRLCERYIDWAELEHAHRVRRDAFLSGLPFPFPAFRPGQRELAEAVFKAHGAGRTLLAQAPTGIGKTMATLFAALRQMPRQSLDRVLYVTARTTGRQLALDGLHRLVPKNDDEVSLQGPPLRVVERVAREKACEYPDRQCHGDSCPLAKGFYDRLPQGRLHAIRVHQMDKSALRNVALEHDLCPYYLGSEMQRWTDVLVGDYNHVFDIGAPWLSAVAAEEWKASLLVDEAHNLIDRVRSMYSCTLHPAALAAAKEAAPQALKRALDRTQRQWNAVAKEMKSDEEELEVPPSPLVQALQQQVGDVQDWMAAHPSDALPHALQQWSFDVMHFLQLCERFGDHSILALRHTGDGDHDSTSSHRHRIQRPVIHLRNIVPGPHVQPVWEHLQGTTLFSATLMPFEFQSAMLGLPDPHARLSVPTPFSSEQLRVVYTPHLSTRWNDRQRSLGGLVAVMAHQYAAHQGNYLAFFSSHDYLQQTLELLRSRHADIPTWAQARHMSEPDRDDFISRFAEDGRGIGFAVLGGAFGEGIDLPGKRLVGAFIATLGMPQVNAFNERNRALLQARFGKGYEYTYLFPGLQKVVQAAGRVIRSETDDGVVWLMDDRFGQHAIQALLPDWWHIELSKT